MITSSSRMYKVYWAGIIVLVLLLTLFSTTRLFATDAADGLSLQANILVCDDIATSISSEEPVTSEPHSFYLPLIVNCPAPAPTPAPTPSPWTDPGAPIEVFSPVTDAIYHSPIEIIGYSRTFEGNVIVRLKDTDGELLAERFTIGGSVDGHDFFHTRLRFEIDIEPGQVMSATVEITHEVMTEEGSESAANRSDTVVIPVLLQKGQRRIDVDSPRPGEALCQRAFISGYSNTFEANVVLTLSERDGTTVEVKATEGGTLGFYKDFSRSFEHEVSEPTALLVSAHEDDARGWGNIDQIRVPISLYSCEDE
jgi:hypothetical protein